MGNETLWTPGPWSWFGNAKMNSLYLATTHSGRRYVMGFERWGMRGAQPLFQPAKHGMVPAKDLVTFEVGDGKAVGIEAAKDDPSVYRYDIAGIDCADARLIAAAPQMAELLEVIADAAKDAISDSAEPAFARETEKRCRKLLTRIKEQTNVNAK